MDTQVGWYVSDCGGVGNFFLFKAEGWLVGNENKVIG